MKHLKLMRPAKVTRAPDFEVPTPNGIPLRLSGFSGKVVLLNFWATWCAPCVRELPDLDRLFRHYRNQGLVVLAIAQDAVESDVMRFLRKRDLALLIGSDPQAQVAGLYGARALPASFLVDRDGTLAATALGPREWDGDAAHTLIRGLLGR